MRPRRHWDRQSCDSSGDENARRRSLALRGTLRPMDSKNRLSMIGRREAAPQSKGAPTIRAEPYPPKLEWHLHARYALGCDKTMVRMMPTTASRKMSPRQNQVLMSVHRDFSHASNSSSGGNVHGISFNGMSIPRGPNVN